MLRLAVANGGLPPMADYKYESSTGNFTKSINPTEMHASNSTCVTVSNNGLWMIVGENSAPYVNFYKRVGGTWVKQVSDIILPNKLNGAAFTQDDTQLILGHNNEPFISIYDISGDTFTQVPFTGAHPTNVYAVAYHPTLDMFVTATAGSPNMVGYKKTDGVWGILPLPESVARTGYGCCFSPDGSLAAVAVAGAPTVVVWDFSEAGFGTRWPDSSFSTKGINSRSVAITKNNTHVVVGHLSSPYISYMQLQPNRIIGPELPVPTLAGYGIAMDVSPDGKMLAIARYGLGYLSILSIDGDTLTDDITYGASPANNGTGITFYKTYD